MPKAKALVLFSGGLDSMLAVKVLEAQGIEVRGICFYSNFYDCEAAQKAAQEIGLNLRTVDLSAEMLELVKNPASGYGRNMNPCIDCHALVFKKAGEIITSRPPLPHPNPLLSKERGRSKKEINDTVGYDFIATGEVLGERPFSQNRVALARVAELAGIEILRPLSAKLLPETEAEKNGLVNRQKLLDLEGRRRERQIALAKKYGLKEYPSPAGGCLLTDQEFSERLMKMLDYWPDCTANDVELLKNGRIFWIKRQMATNIKTNGHKYGLIVVGRNQEEDGNLARLAKAGDALLELKEISGPLTIVRISDFPALPTGADSGAGGFRISEKILKLEIPDEIKMSELRLDEEKSEEEILRIAGLLTGWYATKARGMKVEVKMVGIRSEK